MNTAYTVACFSACSASTTGSSSIPSMSMMRNAVNACGVIAKGIRLPMLAHSKLPENCSLLPRWLLGTANAARRRDTWL